MQFEEPLCGLMERVTGMKERRYQQLLCPQDFDEYVESNKSEQISSSETKTNTVLDRLEALEQRIAKLEALINDAPDHQTKGLKHLSEHVNENNFDRETLNNNHLEDNKKDDLDFIDNE